MSEKDLYPRELNWIEKFGNVFAKVLGWIYSTITVIWSIVLYLPIVVVEIILPPVISFIFTFVVELVQTTTELDDVKPYRKKIGRKFIKAIRTAWRQYVSEVMTIVRSLKVK